MELVSEMNNIGGGEINENGTDLNGDGDTNDNHVQLPTLYNSNPWVTREAVSDWHSEMTSYIKNDLHHTRHLISADYTGVGPMSTDMNVDGDILDTELGETTNACMTDFYDQSWHKPEIDVMSFSNYSSGWNRWEKMAVHEYSQNSQSKGLLCINPNTADNSVVDEYNSLTKPVLYAETGFDICMGDDCTGFVKDVLASAFSGHASSGMSWDEWSTTEHWSVMKNLSQFLENEVFNAVDIGSEEWQPSHQYSEKDPSDLLNENAHDDERVEAVYLRNTDEDNPKYFGVIINRTWNFYTVCSGSCHTQELLETYFSGPKGSLDNLTAVGWENEKIHLKHAGTHNYTIRYYDPITGMKVNEVDHWSAGTLGLLNYPTMEDGSYGHQPYYFFIAFKQGDEFGISPMLPEEELSENAVKQFETFQNMSSFTNEITNINEEENEIQVWPNPTEENVFIFLPKQPESRNYILYDLLGNVVISGNFTSGINHLNLTKYAIGLYELRIIHVNKVYLLSKTGM